MQIYVRTDNNIDGGGELTSHVEGQVVATLSRFSSDITRIEVHLSDESGGRATGADIRCTIQARPTGRTPVTVTDDAGTVHAALTGALHRLDHLLASHGGRQEDQGARASIRGHEPRMKRDGSPWHPYPGERGDPGRRMENERPNSSATARGPGLRSGPPRLHATDRTPDEVHEVTVPGRAGGGPDETIRHLRLRGGLLDGTAWSGVIAVGKRVCCGTGSWSKDCVYVVTDDTTSGPDGQVESVAVVPLHF